MNDNRWIYALIAGASLLIIARTAFDGDWSALGVLLLFGVVAGSSLVINKALGHNRLPAPPVPGVVILTTMIVSMIVGLAILPRFDAALLFVGACSSVAIVVLGFVAREPKSIDHNR